MIAQFETYPLSTETGDTRKQLEQVRQEISKLHEELMVRVLNSCLS